MKKNIILTGPNAAGKTTLLKSSIINLLFIQQIGYGYFKSAEVTPFDYIHSYINIPDTSSRDSLFQAEARRCKEIINVVKENAQIIDISTDDGDLEDIFVELINN